VEAAKRDCLIAGPWSSLALATKPPSSEPRFPLRNGGNRHFGVLLAVLMSAVFVSVPAAKPPRFGAILARFSPGKFFAILTANATREDPACGRCSQSAWRKHGGSRRFAAPE
jgi:hypothetical protein